MDLYSHLHSQLSIFLVIKFNRNPSCPESRALPRADSQVAGEEHVHEVLELVGHLEAEALAHHDVPGRTEPAGANVDLLNGVCGIFRRFLVHLSSFQRVLPCLLPLISDFSQNNVETG